MNDIVKRSFRPLVLSPASASLTVAWLCRWLTALCLALAYTIGVSRSGVSISAPNTWAAHFTSISGGANFACGVLEGDRALCWGDDDGRQTEAPPGRFVQITASYASACGLHPSGFVSCWGAPGNGYGIPSGVRFSTLSGGWGYTCGIQRSRTGSAPVVCFGSGTGWRPFGSRSFTEVSAGDEAVCGLTTSESLRCAYWPSEAAFTPISDHMPRGRFRDVSVGYDLLAGYIDTADTACAIRVDESLVCWGNDDFGQTKAPAGRFDEVSVGSEFVCGLRTSGSAICWGNLSTRGLGERPAGRFQHISAGADDACAWESGSTAVCWGSNGWGEDIVPGPPFTTVTGNCAIRADQSLACWGIPRNVLPSGRFREVSEGSIGDVSEGRIGLEAAGCAVRVDGALTCWWFYRYDHPEQDSLPSGRLEDVSVGNGEACAIHVGGRIVCWGGDPHVRVPAGTFTRLYVGETTACAIRTSGVLACWSIYPGSPALPSHPGRFKEVQTGTFGTCGLEVSGTVACWWPANSADDLPAGSQYMPGTYVQMAGNCGLTAQGGIRCGGQCIEQAPQCSHWHWEKGPWTTGRYTAIDGSPDGGVACAIRASGGLVCWGDPTSIELATLGKEG